MRNAVLVLLGLSLFAAGASVRAEEDPEAFLTAARARHLDHVAAGLSSFEVRILLRRSQDQNLSNYKELADFGYTWNVPEAETFDFENTHELLKKPLRDVLQGMWRDLTGALWFDTLSKLGNRRTETGSAFTLVAGDLPDFGAIEATFENERGTLADLAFNKLNAKFAYRFVSREKGLQVSSREILVNDAPAARLEYRVFRKVNGFLLPTVLVMWTAKNTTEYRMRYLKLNGEVAVTEEPTEEEVRELVKAFEEVWGDLDDFEKAGRIPELAETRHDLVSASVAKLGLRDRAATVRAAAAEALGVMKRVNVVPQLLAALKQDKGEPEVYLAVIQSLGEIGDPRAVPALARGWWSERTGERALAMAQAKIRALGNIPHRDSVDALIDALYSAKDETIGRIAADLLVALEKLTDKDFGPDRKAWKDWWKQARAGFRF